MRGGIVPRGGMRSTTEAARNPLVVANALVRRNEFGPSRGAPRGLGGHRPRGSRAREAGVQKFTVAVSPAVTVIPVLIGLKVTLESAVAGLSSAAWQVSAAV